jgi:acetyl esterase/lipase
MISSTERLSLARRPIAFHTEDIEYLYIDEEAYRSTIYRPEGNGPFPAIVDVHGGAWMRDDVRRDEHVLMNKALASMGVAVVSIDFRQSHQHHYPDSVADVNYAIRWVRKNAARFNASSRCLGAFGSSSGGHLVLLNSMRPADPRYAALPLEGVPLDKARPDYIILACPISDPYVRISYAQKAGNNAVMEFTRQYFSSNESIFDGNPQKILDRNEQTKLPPALLLQGSEDMAGALADKNVSPEIQRRFSEAYRSAGGKMQLEWLPGAPHNFVNTKGKYFDCALLLMKRFIRMQLHCQA